MESAVGGHVPYYKYRLHIRQMRWFGELCTSGERSPRCPLSKGGRDAAKAISDEVSEGKGCGTNGLCSLMNCLRVLE